MSETAKEFAQTEEERAHEIRMMFLNALDETSENYKSQTQSVKTGAIKDSRKLTGNANRMYNRDGFKMSGREIAMLDSAVMHKNADLDFSEQYIGVFSNNYFYICENYDSVFYK